MSILTEALKPGFPERVDGVSGPLDRADSSIWAKLTGLIGASGPVGALAQAVAEDVIAGGDQADDGSIWVTMGSFVLILLVLAVVVFVVKKLLEGVSSLNEEAGTQEAEFMKRLMEESLREKGAEVAGESAGAGEGVGSAAVLLDKEESAELEPVARSAAVAPQGAVADGGARESPEGLLKRLEGLGLLEAMEGRVALPIPPEGLAVRLRDGRSALLLPRQESAELMDYFCRRFDRVIYSGPNGEIFVLERFQARVSEWVSPPKGGGAGLPPRG